MITLLLYTLGGFVVGVLSMALFVLVATRRIEHEDFKRFWC